MTSGSATLATGVRDRALELKLTNNRLSAAAGLSLPTVQKVVRGTGGKVARSTLHRLDRALGWDPGHAEDLLGADLVFDKPVPVGYSGYLRGSDHTHRIVREWTAPEPLHIDVPDVPDGPPPLLSLPDPALRWRSPRTEAGRLAHVERWSYALAVIRIVVAEAEQPRELVS